MGNSHPPTASFYEEKQSGRIRATVTIPALGGGETRQSLRGARPNRRRVARLLFLGLGRKDPLEQFRGQDE